MAYVPDEDLHFLSKCSNEELQPLVDILTIDPKDGKPRITESLTNSIKYKVHSPNHKMYWQEIAEEIQTFGGNSIANIFRFGRGVKYREILIDVCKHLKLKFNESANTTSIERVLLEQVLKIAVEELSENQLQQLARELKIDSAGLTHAALIAAVQGSILTFLTTSIEVSVITGSVLSFVPMITTTTLGTLISGTLLGRILGVATGPIGFALTGGYSLLELASPAMRVTVPVAIQIAFLRLKHSV